MYGPAAYEDFFASCLATKKGFYLILISNFDANFLIADYTDPGVGELIQTLLYMFKQRYEEQPCPV